MEVIVPTARDLRVIQRKENWKKSQNSVTVITLLRRHRLPDQTKHGTSADPGNTGMWDEFDLHWFGGFGSGGGQS